MNQSKTSSLIQKLGCCTHRLGLALTLHRQEEISHQTVLWISQTPKRIIVINHCEQCWKKLTHDWTKLLTFDLISTVVFRCVTMSRTLRGEDQRLVVWNNTSRKCTMHCYVNIILVLQIHVVIMTALVSTKWLTKGMYSPAFIWGSVYIATPCKIPPTNTFNVIIIILFWELLYWKTRSAEQQLRGHALFGLIMADIPHSIYSGDAK